MRSYGITKLVLSLLFQIITVSVVAWISTTLTQGGELGGSSMDGTIRSLITKATSGPLLRDIGGYETVKEHLRRIVIAPLKYPSIFFDPNTPALRPPKGVLLSGPPGTGKTMLARACARESGANFMALNSANLESKWFGDTPKLLQSAFKMARGIFSPCIIFFDEIDGLGRTRSEMDQSCVYSMKCELLRNMDGLEDNGALTVLACTNCPHSLDPALKRRFSQKIDVGLPNENERKHILRVVSGKDHMTDDELGKIAKATSGCSGADIAGLFADACNARLWSIPEKKLKKCANGSQYLQCAGPLMLKHWTHSGRVNIEGS